MVLDWYCLGINIINIRNIRNMRNLTLKQESAVWEKSCSYICTIFPLSRLCVLGSNFSYFYISYTLGKKV